MRALIIMLALLVVVGAGGFFYWRANPDVFTPPPPAVAAPQETTPRRAEFCSAEHGIYVHRQDRTLTLRLVSGPDRVYANGAAARDYGNLGNLFFLVSKDGQEYRFAAASSRGATMNYLFPMNGPESVAIPRGVDLIQMSTFTTDYEYVAGLPRLEFAAPAHIYAPNLTRYLFEASAHRIQAPVDFFDFIDCEIPAQPTPAQPAAAPTGPAPAATTP